VGGRWWRPAWPNPVAVGLEPSLLATEGAREVVWRALHACVRRLGGTTSVLIASRPTHRRRRRGG